MTKKSIALLGAGALCLVVLGVVAWYLIPKPAVAPENAGVQEQPTPFVEPEPILITESTQYYDIHTSYPSKTPLEATAGAKADSDAISTMRQFQEDSIASFKKDGMFDTLTAEDIVMFGYDQGRKQELGIEYVRYQGSRTVSYSFQIYADTMGAHPNTYFRTFTFDLNSGKELRIGDLFISGSSYLETLSLVSRQQLNVKLGEYADPNFINDGTAPQEGSFQSFVIDGNNLTIIFPPYQVGPYAIGIQEVSIPLADLAELLKAEYK